jgi:RNA polymerase sigma-70 factor, ECF subfamily
MGRMTLPSAHSPASATLLTRCVLGEEAAWRDLHREYYPVAFRFLRRMGVSAGELDDVCQEVFVQIFRYLARFEQRADFRTWLYTICLSQARRAQRRRHVREALDWLLRRDPTLGEATFGSVFATSALSTSELAEQVMGVLGRMKPMHKTVLVLFDFEGVTGDEVARILGCPSSTVRRRLHYARQEFETLLRAEAREDERS